ncbi:zeta toxin family protein [Ottowia testudinis]|uniref:AAA family ATPase n=1 Tax=Ottowia testudinis TaxID=2816950 RepID=A0A975H1N9_9BURK|nr:zeta toxin family protein [Ottowia testudinis]QTD44028.1 AAA family ATPase [Ottowia testudinis]
MGKVSSTDIDDAPRVVIFAGPNGAGKSTHADAILQAMGIATFVNADYIARGLAGAHTETVNITAGRIMLRRLHELAAAREDFAFESTLASRSFAPFLRSLKAVGYRVAIYYFSLANTQLAVRRVKLRVKLGGHDVPADIVRRRFARSRANFFALYAPLADDWAVFDNSHAGNARLIAECHQQQMQIKDASTWIRINPESAAPKA